MILSADHHALIEGWQRSFPLVPAPFADVAAALGTDEATVLTRLGELQAAGILSRVGATVRPNTAGASLLAAMRVAPGRLEEIAAIVSAEPCVNHNYEREHEFNLWFVVAAGDKGGLAAALARLRAATGHAILELPMERAYYLDLGFSLDETRRPHARAGSAAAAAPTIAVEDADRRLLAAIEDGLDLVPRPYAAAGRRCGQGEDEVIVRLSRLVGGGIVTRLGLIVRHRALGITANAMAVWDVPDADVDTIGARLAAAPCVTLCYRRPRRPPAWPYNMFAMVHGRDRATVSGQVADLTREAGLDSACHTILFSRLCFVQRGARFKAA